MSHYQRGLDILGATTLGPRGRNMLLGWPEAQRKAEILGVDVKPWDNASSYASGDVVYNDHRYFRALRDVSPPLLPSIMNGEVPGSSDAWREITEAQAYAQPATVLGMFDLNTVQRNMNALAPVTVEIARILLRTGQSTITQAIEGAKQPWYKSDLPGATARGNVRDHLAWHATNLASIRGVNEQTTAYAAGDDLKKWVTEAFVEANAVEEGAAWLDAAWNQMWDEIQAKLAAIPRAVGQAVASVVKTTAGAAGQGLAAGFGMPTWLFWTAAAATVGGLGYVAYKILSGPAGGAVVHHYLGGRR